MTVYPLKQTTAVEGYDALGIAQALAAALKQMSFDLIIAGQRAVDADNYLVGPAVAEYLKIPHISMVIKQEITDAKIKCHRTTEGGTVILEAPLPVLLTTQRGLNEPRYASLPGIMKAKKKPIETKTLADIGIEAGQIGDPLVKITEIQPPPDRKGGVMVPGDTAQAKAEELVKALHEEAKVI
jgi:electron transfer flavoprotein beta subunit